MEDFIIANCTDTGKVRSVNEDSMATFDSPNGRVVVVCDGMGGQNAGDVASQLAVAVIQDILTDNKFASPEEAISKSIIAANQAILVRAAHDVSLNGMGSTCVMLLISGGKVYYGSVGDSRIYYIANGMIRQITKDQSYVQTLVDAGELTQEAAEHHKDKNQITNALGIEGMTPPVICQMPISPEPGGVFLLCSDGLSGMINSNAINQVVTNTALSLQDKAKELVRLANEAGGIDNITVQLVEFPGAISDAALHSPSFENKVARKSTKNRAVLYWSITVVCMILAIGGVTYWLISKEDPQPKVNTENKSEAKGKNTNNANQSNSASQPSTSSQTPETTQIKVIETAKTTPQHTKKVTTKKKEVIKKASEMQELASDENTVEDVANEIKTANYSGEK